MEELEKGFAEIQNDEVIAPVRRALADADVSLRVKEDLASSLDSLKRADREFATIFAGAHLCPRGNTGGRAPDLGDDGGRRR